MNARRLLLGFSITACAGAAMLLGAAAYAQSLPLVTVSGNTYSVPVQTLIV